MNPRRRALPAVPLYAKRALFAGAALAMLWPAVALAQQTNPPVPYEQGPLGRDQRGQVLNNNGQPGERDASKAKQKLGWEPEMSFEKLVAMMVESDIKRCERS